ncbi:hypothetical protein [Prosthecobacter sp.]|uniref:hypothetical protein n=1 Tax=Prosthecobacter sp. TaxID=1965333 RepID=UPI002AB916EB|nr:hypothetical protein [Prosthecobacter sp.]MDZ4404111.1 hypothetical protein [Prosthecobacter sp.]
MPDDEPTPNLAEAAYADAKRFAKEGAFAEALERHEWFHEHALAYQPSYYGVRLSFALSSWRELGTKYPPALEALKRIRDRDTARVHAGDASDEVFHDVVSINHALGDDDATMSLFKRIERQQPDVAKRRFRHLMEVSFSADPALFLRYTPDLLTYFDLLRERHRDMRERFVRLVPPRIAADAEPKFLAALAATPRRMDDGFQSTAEKLSTLARSAGQPDVASRILTLADEFILELRSQVA